MKRTGCRGAAATATFAALPPRVRRTSAGLSVPRSSVDAAEHDEVGDEVADDDEHQRPAASASAISAPSATLPR